MATYSMTGYGRADGIIGSRKYTIEIRSLNSKQLDLMVKIPSLLRELEMDFRSMVAEKLGRGKVEVLMSYENLGGEKSARINTELMEAYAADLAPLKSKIEGINDSDWLNALIKLPEVLVNQKSELSDAEKEELKSLFLKAIEAHIEFRAKEGEALHADLLNNVKEIEKYAAIVEELAPSRVEAVRERIGKTLDEIMDKTTIDKDRFEQELIYYIEKLDINEEIIRLASHIKYFLDTLAIDGAKGKKLGFISQELGREINTMGSKANHAEMQRNVILMKDNLERIKEQTLNVL